MRVTVAPSPPQSRSYKALRDHTAIGRHLAGVIAADPRMRGLVLDVGCGADGPTIEHYFDMYKLPARLDGVDPAPTVAGNPWVTRSWSGEFERCDIPVDTYDALVSINVVEHVARPTEFLRQALRVLKPGGVFYAVTPNAVHPFPPCVKLIQVLGLKGRMVADKAGWNDYPAYYRLNSRSKVTRAARQAGFAAAEFHYHANIQWHQYFPRPLRFAPAVFDRLIGTRCQPMFQMLLWKLEKPGAWGGPAEVEREAERPRRAAAVASAGAAAPEVMS